MDRDREEGWEELARELRMGPGAELRAEAEATERETHQGRLRRRTLEDIGRELAQRGDRVRAEVAGRILAGMVVANGRDYLTVEAGEVEADLRLEGVVMEVQRRSQGGGSEAASRTFQARLAEHEQLGERVQLLVSTSGTAVEGIIRVAASDHLWVETSDGRQVVVPTRLVVAVVRNRPQSI
jgi:hypothetical protein